MYKNDRSYNIAKYNRIYNTMLYDICDYHYESYIYEYIRDEEDDGEWIT